MAMNDAEIISNLKKIVDSVGVGAFANHARANALVSDFFVGNDNAKTRKLIKSIIDIDAFAKISSASNGDLDGVCKAVKTLLVDDESLSEDRAEMAVGWVCGALSKRRPNFSKPVQPKPQIPNIQSGSNSYSSQSSSNCSYTPTKQPMLQPRTVNTPSPNTYGLNLNHHVKRKKKVPKKLIGWTITLCALAVVAYFVVWPKMIYPNMTTEAIYTPEILQTYSGTYSIGNAKGNAIVTFTSCDQSGNLTGFFEFIVDNTYGKYEVAGKINKKKNNGNLVLSLTPGQWVVQPDNYSPLEMMTVEITDKYQSFECSRYSIRWSTGGNDEYSIKTVDDLQKLVGSEATYQLKNDIDLSGVNWKPIEGFKGTLIGNGFTIKNMAIETSASNVGFFSTLSGSVTNLNFENANITVSGSNENIGILCGSMQGTASNIIATGVVNASSSNFVGGVIGFISTQNSFSINNLENKADISGVNYIGGVIGYCYTNTTSSSVVVQLSNIKNGGTVYATGDYAGGTIGYFSDRDGDQTYYLTNANNTGNVYGKTNVGGIVGYASGSVKSYISDSTSVASIEAEACVGCIAGRAIRVSVNNCSNAGSTLMATKYIVDNGNKYAYVGGYVGCGFLVNDCINNVEINYTAGGSFVGGVVGYISSSFEKNMSNLENNANINGADYVGGIIGYYYADTTSRIVVQFSGLINRGTIVGTGDFIGGTIGYFSDRDGDQTLYITKANNTGSVSGKVNVGGILGYASGSFKSYINDSNSIASITGEAYVGCIAGTANRITLNNCSNKGSTLNATKYITSNGNKYAYVGGFVGCGYSANNCTNEVDINYTAGGSYVGGVIGHVRYGQANNMNDLENKGNIFGSSCVGGIIGYYYTDTTSRIVVQFSGLINSGTIVGTGDYIGGTIGYFSDRDGDQSLYISDAQNLGAVKGKTNVGGITGYASASVGSYIIDSKCAAVIEGEAIIGCVAGTASGIAVNNCTNIGSALRASKYVIENNNKCAYVGGFVGKGYTANDCANEVVINYMAGGSYVGGIIGYINSGREKTMSNLENNVNVNGANYVGGIIGYYYANTTSRITVQFDNMKNNGNVKGNGDYIGGIVGFFSDRDGDQTLYMSEAHNYGNVEGSSYVGGIVGYAKASTSSYIMDSTTAYGKIAGKLERITIK